MLSRRELLRVGSAAIAGLSLPRLLEAAEHSSRVPRADHCVILFLNGGPSHLDMWDMKPDAPAEIRGEFQPISTTLPGVSVCEHLPRLAQHMHRCTLVRSMHHSVTNAHALAVYTALTGHDRGDANQIVGTGPEDRPTPGAVASYFRPAPPGCVPHAVLPYKTKEGATGPPQPGYFGGMLGPAHDPLFILKDPNAADFAVPELSLPKELNIERLAARGDLLTRLNGRLLAQRAGGPLQAMGKFQQRAFEVLTSDAVRQAFRIQDEPDTVREQYGRNIYGQSVLLARRLIESGTRLVTISWAPDANATWDTHGSNFKKLKDPLLPQFDAACSSLLQDLHDRGLLDRTIVAVLGDFGRTPKINANDGGRDHWNYCYTVMLAGGGFRPGFVYGASDKIGGFPSDLPTTPSDIIATIYHLLGIDPHARLYDRVRRPHEIVPEGEVVHELIS